MISPNDVYKKYIPNPTLEQQIDQGFEYNPRRNACECFKTFRQLTVADMKVLSKYSEYGYNLEITPGVNHVSERSYISVYLSKKMPDDYVVKQDTKEFCF